MEPNPKPIYTNLPKLFDCRAGFGAPPCIIQPA